MRNLFNKLRFYITNPLGKKQFACKKNDFCDCSVDLTDMCVTCLEQNRGRFAICPPSDDCKLDVDMVFPVQGATDVSVDSNPVVVFTENLDPLLANYMTVMNADKDIEIDGTREIVDGNTMVFTPTDDLPYETEIEVSFGGYISSDCFVEDTFTFTTEDVFVFNILSQSPAQGGTGVSVNSVVQTTFNGDLDPVAPNSVSLTAGGVPVPGTQSIVFGMPNVLSFSPTLPLECNTTYNGSVTGYSIDGVQNSTGFISFTTEGCPPVAEFSVDVLTGADPLDVQFTDLSTNTPTQRTRAWSTNGFVWNQFSIDQNPLMTFTMPGTYSIRLTVQNDGGSDTIVKTGLITVTTSDIPPVADFTYLPNPATGAAPLEVSFTDTSTGGPGDERVWDYRATGGGMRDPRTNFSYGTDPLVNQNPTFQFPNPGTYDVRFTVRNGGGSQSSEIIKVGIITVS